MKRAMKGRRALVVSSGAMMVLCVLAGTCFTGAQTRDQAVVPVTCRVVAALEATFPGAVTLGNLNVGAPPVTSAPQSVTVRSNAPWALNIKADAQDGRLRQWIGTAYLTPNPKMLSSPLEWKRQDGAEFVAISSNEAAVVSNMPPTGSAGTTVSIVFRQSASYDDEALPDPGHTYRIEVTYTATQTY